MYDRLADEWQVGPGGQLLGLPTPSIESALRLARIPAVDRGRLLAEVKLISRTIAAAINEETKRKRDAKHP